MNKILYKHTKTGNLYRILYNAIDCTNSRDGERLLYIVRLVKKIKYM